MAVSDRIAVMNRGSIVQLIDEDLYLGRRTSSSRSSSAASTWLRDA